MVDDMWEQLKQRILTWIRYNPSYKTAGKRVLDFMREIEEGVE